MKKIEKQLWQITSRVGVTAGRIYGVYADTEKEAREIFRKKAIGMIVNIKKLSGHSKPSNMLNSINEKSDMQEGLSDYLPSADSINAFGRKAAAFGRNAADTATFGGYKYARAGADYAVKNIASKLGYGKGTDYDTELKQEKDKLARDDVKNPQAAAAGDIAGYATLAIAPELPVVGRAIGSTLGAVEKASKIPYYVGLARKAVGMEEEAPANAVGGGNIAALGVGPNGEPGRAAKMMPMVRRGKFAGKPTFIVSSATFNALREAKKSRKHWRKYLDEDSAYHDLREYAKKCKGPIIVEDERTGACMYVRYGKGGSLQEAWTNQVGKMALVASVNLPKKKKLSFRRKK